MAPTRPACTASTGRVPKIADGAGVRSGQAEQHVDGGGLAGAVRTEEGHHLARRDVQVDPANGLDVAEALVQAGHPDGCAVGERALPQLVNFLSWVKLSRDGAGESWAGCHDCAMTSVMGARCGSWKDAAVSAAGEYKNIAPATMAHKPGQRR